jgi:hypothetical protein
MNTNKTPTRISIGSPLRMALVSSLAFIVLASCGDRNSTVAPEPQTEKAPKTAMQGRLEAAIAYDGPAIGRHNMLAELAREAAEAGEGDVAVKAIQSMDDAIVNSDGGTINKANKYMNFY